jgi:hypothetical protein
MTTFIAANLTLFFFAFIVGLLERTHRRTAGLPRAPFGVDLERESDLRRVEHDLEVHRA